MTNPIEIEAGEAEMLAAEAEGPGGLKISALAPWFGGNRTRASRVGQELGPLGWCGVFCCGGLPEVPWIRTQAGVCLDLHRHVINLASVVADPVLLCRMIRRVERLIFHSDVLALAQRRCLDREHESVGIFGLSVAPEGPDVGWAADYFIACWMGRGGLAGQDGEFAQSLSIRWTASGGSSAKRWRSAVDSLPGWGKVLERWQFACKDLFDALARLKPQKRAGLYIDPPWVGLGDRYSHKFTAYHHRALAANLRRLSGDGYRIVVRYGDHPLVRELYSGTLWRWVESVTVNQQGGDVPEVLIINGPEIPGAEAPIGK